VLPRDKPISSEWFEKPNGRFRFARAGGSSIAQSPEVREDIVSLRSGKCLEDSLGAVSRLGNQEVYSVVVAALTGEFYPGRLANIMTIEEVPNILEEETCNPRLGHYKHVIDGQHRLSE
jgi:hypothetical protein